MRLLFVWLSPEGRLLCLDDASESDSKASAIDPKSLPDLAAGRVCVGYDCLPIFLVLGQAGVAAPLRFFDLSRFFRAFYGVKEELPIDEAFTQFGERERATPAQFLARMADYEGLSPDDVFGEGYRDCYLEYPQLLNGFLALDRHRRLRQRAIDGLHIGKMKKLVFFDIECANCFGGVCQKPAR